MKKLLVLLALVPVLAFARVDIGGVYGVNSSERIKDDLGYFASIGKSTYLWGSYQKTPLQMVGQNLGKLPLYGVGLGARDNWGKWEPFIEVGYFISRESTDDAIRDEAVVASLQKDHGKIRFHPEYTEYKLGNGIGGRVGVNYRWSKAVLVRTAYRAVKLDEGYDACTVDPKCEYPIEGGRHWQNRKTLDASAFEFGLLVRF